SAGAFEPGPVGGDRRVTRRFETDGTFADEGLIDSATFDERSQRSSQKGEVAAGVDVEPVIRKRSAEERTRRNRWNPITLEARFTERVDDGDPGALHFGVVQILRRHRLVVRDVRSEQDDQIGAEPD